MERWQPPAIFFPEVLNSSKTGMRIKAGLWRGILSRKKKKEVVNFEASLVSETREALDRRSVFRKHQFWSSEAACKTGGAKLERQRKTFHNFLVLWIKSMVRVHSTTYLVALKTFTRF